MDDVVVSWSVENWITVVLMVALSYAAVVLVTKIAQGQMGGGIKTAPQQ